MVDENLKMQDEVEYDLVIVGAARQYPGFRSESGLRMTGFSDIPIVLPPNAKTYHDTCEAKYVTKYLEEYVDVHVYNEKSLRGRVICRFKVGGIEKIDGIWSVWSEVLENRNGNEHKRMIKTKKLAIATGQNALPYIPTFPSQMDFPSPIVHQKQSGEISTSALGPDSPYTAVTILGEGKSAADMVYECVKAGKKLSWLIRQSGEGPAIFAGAKGRGQYRNGAEMSATPSCFAEQTWWSKFIHRSSIFNSTVSRMWRGADEEAAKLADFEREDAPPGFEGLKFESEIFWCNSPLGLIHHDDFWDTVARNVRVYRGDIAKLDSHAIVLENGTICCYVARDGSEDILQHTQDQHETNRAAPTTPTRLYNLLAPLNDLENPSLVFLSHIHLSNAFRLVEAQAIWSTAYFSSHLSLPPDLTHLSKNHALSNSNL
ncbi:hypothetical protein EAF00_005764 [Botryotinia globosa]|nr:hypothetical protein EAF00_005764 [Botryotinia globosa]